MSEAACFRSCRWIEETLMQGRVYRLPGKKVLLASDAVFETVLIDATQKNKSAAILAKRNATR